MDRFRGLAEDSAIFLVMSIFSVIRTMISSDKPIEWGRSIARMFSNLVAGVGFYSFLLSYKEWYGEYPQKIGVIMFVTYAGSRVVDLFTDKIYTWIKKTDIRQLIKNIIDLF